MTPTGRAVLRGGDVVLPDRVAERHAVIIAAGRIVEVVPAAAVATRTGDDVVDVDGAFVVPGFVDLHIHGAGGHDVLDGPGSVAKVAAILPRIGVTSWCPTSVACSPGALDAFLTEVASIRASPGAGARVLGAHLESSFINPACRGAQPLEWLRTPADGAEILDVMRRHRGGIGTVTLAPEIAGGAALLASLVAEGIRVSLGHSAATFDEAEAAFRCGARGATHLFNRMPPLAHREPGLAGAALAHPDVTVEVIGDGWHLHPAMLRLVWAAKGPARVAAITDATAGAGCPPGARVKLGGRSVTVGEIARLDDGTVAGSVTTMAEVWARWIRDVHVPVVDATAMCAATPATAAGRPDLGRIEPGAPADLVALDSAGRVRRTWIGGVPVFGR